jgi:hypothetical protein
MMVIPAPKPLFAWDELEDSPSLCWFSVNGKN